MKPSIESKVLAFISAVANLHIDSKGKTNLKTFITIYLAMYTDKSKHHLADKAMVIWYSFLDEAFDNNVNINSLPDMIIFWETESINRRVDKRHSKPIVKGLQITGKIDLRKWQGRIFTPLSISLDNNNFGWIERDYLLSSCTDEDRFYDIFSRVQLHYFKCTRGHSRNKSMYTFDSIIWKMLLDDFYACTGNRNGIQIQSYYNHLLRQSMNELDCGSWYTKAGWAA